MKPLRIVCLGNAVPRAYRNNPVPPEGATIEQCLAFADALGVDVSGRLLEGQEVREGRLSEGSAGGPDPNGQVLYVATAAHEMCSLREILARPVEIPYFGPKARTKIKFSPDSMVSQCIAEAKTIWAIHGSGVPGWIAGNNPVLVGALAEEFGITEIRDYEEDGT